MLLFRRTLMREMLYNGAAALLVLTTITATTLLIRAMGKAAVGKVANEAILPVLGFGLLNAIPVLMALAVFIGVILTLVRAFRDSEMVIWFSSGLSPLALIRPVLYCALPMVVAIAVLSLVILPMGAQKRDEYRRWLASQDDASMISPGVFAESRHADRVYFVEALGKGGDLVRNVFMQSLENGRLGIVVASQGYRHVSEDGGRYLVLEKGRRYEGTPGQADFRIVEFERYWARIETYEAEEAKATKPGAMSTLGLLRNPTPANMSEWVWRVGHPLSALILALLAIPLSFVNPRAGRSFNLILALFIYATYNNLIGLSQVWVGQNKIPAAVGLLWVHAAMAAVLVLLFYLRLSVRKPVRGKRVKEAAA
jgi:lipopolysaccharide export system permease protein